ncbi:hypothetical protein AGABI2DRAFT_206829, partial [Agaricus bisporus var. bisporus H97]|uniref:hypothetical protein n=1 Tax=Agaricus bisporus var. bisporus (strain H97 / ATCC MYA-4626 / FGSC 10389) TaxID=936046 RepID=UPI00029F6177
MAHLDKLAIRGIRSFDDKQIAIVEFFSPVTVIVGHNGSGKTTIIECLKYATTGDQPPGTRGGAFIHDPKMANEKEVKAQVKLRFYAANGIRMLAVRNLSLTAKKTTMTMKTLEGILSLADESEKTGKRSTISTKCAEMDNEIPQLLGVSKAVLDNVIFCHQEESYWPFSEPSNLKKKFDEIFEATRYAKALDSIKTLRKDRITGLKTDNAVLAGLKQEKDRADDVKKNLAETRSIIANKELEHEQLKQQYDAQVISNQQFLEHATKFRETYIHIENLVKQKERLQEDYKELKLNLQELAGTDQELETRLSNFDEHIGVQKRKLQAEFSKKADLEGHVGRVRQEHTDCVAQRGRLLGEADAHKMQVAEREQLIHEISEKHKIKGFNYSPLEREKAHEFLSRLDELRRKQIADLDKIQTEIQDKSNAHQRKVLEMESDLTNKKLKKAHLQEQIHERQINIRKTERQLEDEQTIKSELTLLQGDIQEKRSRLAKL